MAIEITSDSIVKVLVRRGTDSERQLTTLTEGELGYCIDTQRLFIGDGITLGGIVAGNKFLGFASDRNAYSTISQSGDMIYQTAGTTVAETLYAYDKVNNIWRDIHPKPYRGDNGIYSLEKSAAGTWRTTSDFVGGTSIAGIPHSGLTLSYDGDSLNSITNVYNRIDFDSRYISLCAAYTSFYLGNINSKFVTNNLDATLNVDKNIYINEDASNPYQLKLFAKDPAGSSSSLLQSISGDFNVKGNLSVGLFSNNYKGLEIRNSGSLITTTVSASPGNLGSYASPSFNIKGVTKFEKDVWFDTDSDVTILGNLSVFGDATYIETTVTTTSALSVINKNSNEVSMVVAQLNSGAVPNQTIARFLEANYATPNLQIKEQQFVGINVPADATYISTGSNNFVVYGGALFRDHPLYSLGNKFTVGMSNTVTLTAGNSMSLISPSVGIQGTTTVTGSLYVTQDVVAFSSSDERLKDNKVSISNALDKVEKLNGISFDWNEKSGRSGKSYGLLAQEVEEVLPHAVITREDGYKAVDYEKVVPLLIEAIKELNNRK